MARFKARRGSRYNELIAAYFTPREARELSVLPKKTPALQQMMDDRLTRRSRFEKIASRKIANGQWSRRDVPGKWIKNLTRMYSKRGWRVQHGAVGNQPKMPKGSPNVWAAYRGYEKAVGGPGTKNYVSPWELRQVKSGKTLLDKGLLYVQKQERKGGTTSGVSKATIQQWIDGLDKSISKARGKRKQDLIAQRDRLRRQL
jgi:hypothetical protein